MRAKLFKLFYTNAFVVSMLLLNQACRQDDLIGISNQYQFLPQLSQYSIFDGSPSALKPAADYELYELATPLFSDYAEKQRLIKLPAGMTMTNIGESLPDFPDGTIIVKTFYYEKDERDPTQGRKLIESRLLVKLGAAWNVATYLWNDTQTDADLVTSGSDKTINWIDGEGTARVISYRVPSLHECTTCHQSGGVVLPIGPKLRNLNRTVLRNGSSVNQLTYLQQKGLLSGGNTAIAALPDWSDTLANLESRARAYMDVNCAHCHNDEGYAANSKLYLNFDRPFNQTAIGQNKKAIDRAMETGSMPRLGTTLVDAAGLKLIKAYISTLP